MSAGLIGFVLLKPLCRWLNKKGWTKQPFTAQENTVMQTTAMAMTSSSAPPTETPLSHLPFLIIELAGSLAGTFQCPVNSVPSALTCEGCRRHALHVAPCHTSC